MKKAMTVLAAVAALVVVSSCEKISGEGPLMTETRQVSGFTGVSAGIPGRILYTIDTLYKLELTAQQNILDVIETYKENGHLTIRVRHGVRLREHEDITIHISAPLADFLQLSGSGNLNVSGRVQGSQLETRISGSGSITVAEASISGMLKADISGSGDIRVQSGAAREEDLRISGSGKIVLDGLTAETAVSRISGSGDIYLKLSQSLDASISGSGSVYYRGNPLVTTHISGSGRVRPL